MSHLENEPKNNHNLHLGRWIGGTAITAVVLTNAAIGIDLVARGASAEQNPCYGTQFLDVKQGEQVNQTAAELSAAGVGNVADISKALRFYNEDDVSMQEINGTSVYVFNESGNAVAPKSCLVSNEADD